MAPTAVFISLASGTSGARGTTPASLPSWFGDAHFVHLHGARTLHLVSFSSSACGTVAFTMSHSMFFPFPLFLSVIAAYITHHPILLHIPTPSLPPPRRLAVTAPPSPSQGPRNPAAPHAAYEVGEGPPTLGHAEMVLVRSNGDLAASCARPTSSPS